MSSCHNNTSLEEFLDPCNSKDFFNDFFGRNMLYVRGRPGKFKGVFSWSELNRILAEHQLESPRMYLAQKGSPPESLNILRKSISSGLFQRGMMPNLLDLAALNAKLKAGATLIVNSVEQTSPQLADICDNLARCLGTFPLVNVYATFRSIEGFGSHWDDHEVIILQIAGRKEWRVFRPTSEAPLVRDIEAEMPPLSTAIFNEVLGDGDLLYLPRGWWHAPCGLDEPSLHLTVSMPMPNGLDVVDWLFGQLGSHAVLRRDLPQFEAVEQRRAHARAMKEVIDSLWSDDLIDEFLRMRRSLLATRSHPSLPFGAMSSPVASLRDFYFRYSGVAYVSEALDGIDNKFRVTFAGNSCIVNKPMSRVLSAVFERKRLSFGELYSLTSDEIDEDTLRDFIGDLLSMGVIHLEVLDV